MASDTIKLTLGDCLRIKHGFAFKGDYIGTEDNGIVLVTPGNFEIGGGFKEKKCKFFSGEYSPEYVLHAGDLIVTMTDLSKQGDTLGYSALVPKSSRVYLHNQRIGLVDVYNPKADKGYIYWFMRTPKYQKMIVASASGSTVKHTSPSRICEIEIDLPPIEKQKKIATTLTAIDRKIELNNRINDNLQQQAMALYASMFLDNSALETTTGTLKDIADITMGQSPSGSSYNEDGNGEVFYQGRAEFGYRFPTRRLYTTEPKRMAEAGDVLLSVRAPVGDLNVAYERCCIGRGLGAIHSRNGHQSFVLYTMFALRPQLDVYNGEGTVFGSINRNALNNMPIDIPSEEAIAAFETVVRPMDDMIRSNYEENCRLQELRNTLLPRLMSGEIDVSDIQL